MHENLIEAINRGINGFRSCNWTHENGRDDEDEPIYCDGDAPDVCETCRRVERDAASAVRSGQRALALLQNPIPDLPAVLAEVESAQQLEIAWGDDPAWSDARREARRAVTGEDE